MDGDMLFAGATILRALPWTDARPLRAIDQSLAAGTSCNFGPKLRHQVAWKYGRYLKRSLVKLLDC